MSVAANAITPLTPEAIRLFIDQNGNRGGGRRSHASRRNIVRVLWDLIDNGAVENKSGRATQELRARVTIEATQSGRGPELAEDSTFFTFLLKEMDRAGLIDRLLYGRRTLRIEAAVTGDDLIAAGYPRSYSGSDPAINVLPLEDEDSDETPEDSSDAAIGDDASQELPPESEPDPELPPITVNVDGLTVTGILIEAMSLLSRAIPLTAGSDTPEVNPEVLDRLATVLADNERLRRKLREAGDNLRAVQAERDGLRRAKQMLEANLSEMARGSLNEQTYRRYVELDRLVRSAPGSMKGDD